MAISRYKRTVRLDLGQRYGTSRAISAIRRGISDGTITFTDDTISENVRIDVVAANEYGDGRYWWVIAAASDIGWAPQIPPGTYIRIPNLDEVLRLVG